jgi:hypothetical protein
MIVAWLLQRELKGLESAFVPSYGWNLERMLDTLDVEAEAEAAVKREQQQQLEQQLQQQSN